jgi:hypothetical protein
MEYRTFDMDDVLRMRRAILATFLELGFRIAGDEPGDSISCRMAAETSFGRVGVQVTPRGDAQLDVRLEPLGVHDGTAPFPYELFFNSISKRLYLAAHRS